MRRDTFIDTYARHLREGQAAVFLGAGLSMRAGYPSWRDLLKDIAEELGLDLELEADLPGLVQFHLNRASRTRTRLTRTIEEHFLEEREIPQALRTLARLPLRHVWTTNYDRLTEQAWREAHRRFEIKLEDEDLRRDAPYAHSVLYKMHGCITRPAKVIIAKGDYELYRRSHPAFVQHLVAQLASKRFLFLGFSFTDPNVRNLFALMRETYGDNPPESYTIVRRPQKPPKGAGRSARGRYDYEGRRHALWVEDLGNYGIQCVEIDDWSELDDILDAVERSILLDSVMVSGSYPESGPGADAAARRRLREVADGIGRLLAGRGIRLVSGFGLTVGDAVVAGALDRLYATTAPNLEQSLYLRPFPQELPEGQHREEFHRRYREEMLSHAGAVIYLGGMKEDQNAPGRLRLADGVLAEFEIATQQDRFPIPVAATGGAAAEIWRRIDADYARHVGMLPRALFDALNDDTAATGEMIATVGKILDWLASPKSRMATAASRQAKT